MVEVLQNIVYNKVVLGQRVPCEKKVLTAGKKMIYFDYQSNSTAMAGRLCEAVHLSCCPRI